MKIRTILRLASAAVLASSASADLLIYEPFDYADTGPNDGVNYLGDGNQAGGLGLGQWRQVNNSDPIANELEVLTPGLTFTDIGSNVLPSSGGYAIRTNRTGQAAVSSDVDPGATVALTADNSTMWMSFLFVDRGFSGPTSAIMLASEDMTAGDTHNLSAAGYGVGVAIRATTNPNRAPHTAYYNGTTGYTTNAAADKFLSSGEPEGIAFLYALKVNWKPDGTPDEMFLFEIDDLTTEPNEADAIVSDTFDMSLVDQQSLNVLNIGETQVDGVDEIRLGTTFAAVVGSSQVGVDPKITSITVSGNVATIQMTGDDAVGYWCASSTDLIGFATAETVYQDAALQNALGSPFNTSSGSLTFHVDITGRTEGLFLRAQDTDPSP